MNLTSPCTPFPGPIDRGTGYGSLSKTSAHRATWILHNGPIPKGLVVGHACHDADESCSGGPSCPHRRCVNIDHLVLMTYSENTKAAIRNRYAPPKREYVRSEFCKRGHNKSGMNRCPRCKTLTQRKRLGQKARRPEDEEAI